MNEQLLNKVICADCFDVFPQIADASIDLIFCDLPYNITTCDWDKEVIPLDKLWKEYNRVLKDTGTILLTACQPFTSKLVASNYKQFKTEWIWEKNISSNPGNAKRMPLKVHESILVFVKKRCGTTYNPQGLITYDPPLLKTNSKKKRRLNHLQGITADTYYQHQGNYPKSVQRFNVSRGNHPTEKSLSMLEYFIKTYSNEGDTILDNCAGSFSLAVAADNTNRNWICVEKEKEYCEIGLRRVNHKPISD